MARHSNSQGTEIDIASLDINEPLAESAMLAQQWSKDLCTDCGSYHGAWQILRLLGALNSMRSDDDFLVSQLDVAIAGGASKILISGAADYALQARIAAVADRHNATPQVTVIDRCKTPLELNRWFATRTGMNVEVVQGDILNFRNPGRFDLVCTHSFLSFFNEDERKKLAAVWWDCLVPGGAVLTAQRARPNDTSLKHGFSDSQATSLGQRAEQLAIEKYDRLGIDPEQVRRLAIDYAINRSTYLVRSSEQLRQLFLQQGFELEVFAPPDGTQIEKDIPSTPTEARHCRWRILARKPGV